MKKLIFVMAITVMSSVVTAQNSITNGKFGFSDGLSDGRSRGIWLWSHTDPNHVIYSCSYTGISPGGNDAADGLWSTTTSHRLRFRTYNQQGFLFENHLEQALIDIDAGNGNLKSIGIAHFVGLGSNYFAGNMGIGTASPGASLTVKRGSSNGGTAEFYGTERISHFNFSTNEDTYIRGGKSTSQVILNDTGGNVGIGTSITDAKLTVKGDIHAERVRVDLNIPAPDYVFEEDYDLRSLEETANYIQENKHLPEVPSAKVLKAEGIDLVEMNMLLLKKIEELTLHQIRMEKQISKLNAELLKTVSQETTTK